MTAMTSFLNQLNKMNFTSYSDDKLKSEDGWEVSYHVKLCDTLGFTDSVFQVIPRVTYKGVFIQSYGCVTHEETNEFGEWFMKTKGNLQNAEYDKVRALEKIGKAILKSLG